MRYEDFILIKSTLEWYADAAKNLKKYLATGKYNGAEAIMTELQLDNGKRAEDAIVMLEADRT